MKGPFIAASAHLRTKEGLHRHYLRPFGTCLQCRHSQGVRSVETAKKRDPCENKRFHDVIVGQCQILEKEEFRALNVTKNVRNKGIGVEFETRFLKKKDLQLQLLMLSFMQQAKWSNLLCALFNRVIDSGAYLRDWGWADRAAGSGRHPPGPNAGLSCFRAESLVLHTQFKDAPFRGDWMSFQLWDLLQDTPLCEGAGLGRDCGRDALFNLHPLQPAPRKRKIISSQSSVTHIRTFKTSSLHWGQTFHTRQRSPRTAHRDLDYWILRVSQ